MCAQTLKWGKREPLSRNCRSLGVSKLFGRRHWRQRTTLKPGHPLTAPALAADNLIPQKRRKNYKVGGGETSERRGRWVERRRGCEGNFFPRATHSCQASAIHPPASRNLHAPPRSIVASFGLPSRLCLRSLFLFFSLPPAVPAVASPTRRALLSSSVLFISAVEVFAKEPIGGSEFRVSTASYDGRGSENLFSISATPTGSRSIRVMYRVISK